MNQNLINRVPSITMLYWVIKIASTTLGETGADMVSMTLNCGYAATIGIFLALFVLLFLIKLSLKCYSPTAYWLTFTSTAIAGTAISDFIDRSLGLGYALGSMLLLVLLLINLLLWYWKEQSISVEFISTQSSESFYWFAFLLANTLGTAAGDYLSDDLSMGFLQSTLLIGLILLVLGLLHYFTALPKMLLFWLAFVLTRPFGATFGDLLTKSVDKGGLNLGTYGASLFFALALGAALYVEIQLHRKARPMCYGNVE